MEVDWLSKTDSDEVPTEDDSSDDSIAGEKEAIDGFGFLRVGSFICFILPVNLECKLELLPCSWTDGDMLLLGGGRGGGREWRGGRERGSCRNRRWSSK